MWKALRHNPLYGLLLFVPVVLVTEHLRPKAHTALFFLSVVAIVPLAALLSHSTESVASKTGDAVGGLLNATLGNLTELVIAITALRAGMLDLVKASLTGAVVTNSLFMLGGAFLLGGLRHPVQEFNPRNARVQAGMLLLATIALLVPSAVSRIDQLNIPSFMQPLSVSLSVILLVSVRAEPPLLAQDASRVLHERDGRRARKAVAAAGGPRRTGCRNHLHRARERSLRRRRSGSLRRLSGCRGPSSASWSCRSSGRRPR